MDRISLACRALAFFFIVSVSTMTMAQTKPDQLGASLGLTPEAKSLPLWQKPPDSAVQDMAHTIKGLKEAVMLVGDPDPKLGRGTAFVISRKYRLLATNAHVADIMKDKGKMFAIRNGTAVLYIVDKAWYHPGVRRFKNALLSVRSPDPADGEVDPMSPDVAVLHLADGPDLPEEFPLATVEEEQECLGSPIGMMGYPGHDTDGWPRLGEKAQATLHEGIVCRLTDFLDGVSGSSGEMQRIQHSLANWFGFSGSPLFLPNGHVIGLNNAGRPVEKGGFHVVLSYGVRVDCLWELLVYHHLDDKVAIAGDKSKLLLARYFRPDPAFDGYNRAARLVSEVDHLLSEKKFVEAIEKCNEAIEICPGYSKAYLNRALLYTNYNVHQFPGGVVIGTPVNPVRLKRAQLALEDALMYVKMNPNSTEALLTCCMKKTDVDIIRQVYNPSVHESVIGVTTKIIEDPSVSKVIKARAYTARAAIKTNIQDNWQYNTEIYADYDSAIRLDPFNAALWRNRASYDVRGTQQEQRDNRRARQLDQAEQFAARAMYLATTTDDNVRDGDKAWELAVKACQATKYRQPYYLSALAAAYAECGDFDNAIEYGKKAIQLADEDAKDGFGEQLKLYLSEQPLRQTAE